ncbi:MAG: hypothetical protein NTY45_08385 [Elusimicrobia bacterium]|nr:hypothetical protein [Elusimicrobiota bacterium]
MNKILLTVLAVAVSSGVVNALELEKVNAKEIVKLTQTGEIVVPAIPAAQASREAKSDWQHGVLRAVNGTVINVDYLTRRLESDPNSGDTAYVYADPVWINVSNPAFTGNEAVTVELSGNPTETFKLWYAGGGRYTGRPSRDITLLFHHHGVDYPQSQELSVRVGENYLIDPVSVTETFKLNLPWLSNVTSKAVSGTVIPDVKAAESVSYQCTSLDNNGPYGINEIKLEINGRNEPLLLTFTARKEVTEKYLIDGAYIPKPGSPLAGFFKANVKDADHTAYAEGAITSFYVEEQVLLGKGGVIQTSGAGYSWARYSCVR